MSNPFEDYWRTLTLEAVDNEARRADHRYGSFNSSHEGYGVIAEEVAELLDAIRTNDLDAVLEESIQVAAVAVRIAEATRDPKFARRSGGTAVVALMGRSVG